MDAATLYVRERENARATIARDDPAGDERGLRAIRVYLEDGLPNDRFVQPLTVLFDVPESWVDVPLAIEDGVRRWPDQVASTARAALSFPPFEREFRISPALTPYEADPDADAGR